MKKDIILLVLMALLSFSVLVWAESSRKDLATVSCSKYLERLQVQPSDGQEFDSKFKIDAMNSMCSISFPDGVVAEECAYFRSACGSSL